MTQPFFSVIINTYNGATTIGRTIESLLDQDYPANRYEIIVIDDGSTDTTAQVVKGYPVRYHYQRNGGHSSARNAGLAIARGDVYVGIDDDCIAFSNLLSEFAQGYADGNPIGVSGVITESTQPHGLLQHYIEATGHGSAPRSTNSSHRPSLRARFKSYIASKFQTQVADTAAKVEVEELYGANGSYPIAALRAVGGWDVSMSGIEDRDLSRRLRNQYPDRPFYAVANAKIIHDPDITLGQYLLRPWKRGPKNLAFHRRNHLTPPVFPFPLLLLGAIAVAFTARPLYGLLTALVLPQLLYAWWPLRAITTNTVWPLIYPYLQATEEGMVIAGLIRGTRTMQLLRGFIVHTATRELLVIAIWFISTFYLRGWMLTAVSLPFLLLAPGYFIYRLIAGYRQLESRWNITVYAVGLSLIFLMVFGLAVNELGLTTGNQHPLQTTPLAIGLAWSVSILALAVARRHPKRTRRLRLRWQNVFPYLAGISLPVLAVTGAITLNNGGSNFLSVAAFFAIALYFLYVVWRHPRSTSLHPYALFVMSLALLLGTSLRGWNITGHDIMQEFQVFQLTSHTSAWHMSAYQDAYNACLSITILPTVIQRLTGLPDAYVYKLVFQIAFALSAPILYLSVRRYVSALVAFIAGFIFISFPTFLTDMTMLNRQEAAFIFLGLAIMAGLDTNLSRQKRSLFTFIFLAGMVFAHYSTSYVTVALLIVATAIAIIWRCIDRVFKRRRPADPLANLRIIPTSLVIATLLMLIAWNTLSTQTSNNLSSTFAGILPSLPKLFTPAPAGPKLSGQAEIASYAFHMEATRTLAPSEYYSNPAVDAAPVAIAHDTVDQATPLARSLHLPETLLYPLFDQLKQIYAKLIQALIILGLILTAISAHRRYRLPRRYVILGLASLAVIALQVILPAGIINYGLLRLIQQSLLVLAVPVVVAAFWLLGLLQIPERLRPRLLAVSLCLFFVVLSGALPALTGGYKPALAVSNSGFYYDAYYGHQADITAEQWMASHIPTGSQVYSDEFARRQMIAYSGIFSTPTLIPGAIPVDSYVFLSTANVATGRVAVYYNGDLIFYQVPRAFLMANKNLIYNSGGVEIYR